MKHFISLLMISWLGIINGFVFPTPRFSRTNLFASSNSALSLKPKDSVKQILTPFSKIKSTGTVADAVASMNAMERSSVIVVDENDAIAGIFTERDFVNKVLDNGKSASQTSIVEVMTPRDRLCLVNPDDSIGECRDMMVKNKIRHLPVVNSDNIPLGVISMTQVIRSLQQQVMEMESANLFGDSLADVEQKARQLANELAQGEATKQQDILRTAYVAAGSLAGALLLQAGWVHDHEWLSMSAIFLLGYIGIVFENAFEFNKAAIALLMCVAQWTIYAGEEGASGVAVPEGLATLSEKLAEVSEVVFFLLGAMTIVEIVDAHQGFKVVTDKITSKNKRTLMWVLGGITFFMSAILDNLTTTIVMVSLIKKIIPDDEDRKLFGAMIVIAANAGGAWTPIGDVTTTMLWINGQITALPTMLSLFLPSVVSTIVPIAILQHQLPENATMPEQSSAKSSLAPRGSLVFATGILGLLSVPVFKALTGLPPYLGMLSALGTMWALTDAIHAPGADGDGRRDELMAPAALSKIDASGVLFFLGILLSVGALDAAGILRSLAEVLEKTISNDALLASIIGAASAVIDNVPLVAATMGMYQITDVLPDAPLWQMVAYCAGTGGSMLVIGSAAGVALMGLEKVDFFWYLKKISGSALAGYLAGLGVYLAQGTIASQFAAPAVAAAPVVAATVASVLGPLMGLDPGAIGAIGDGAGLFN